MNRLLALAGLIGGLFWIALHTVFSPDWGTPGTSGYVEYEAWNRLWPIALALMLCGFLSLYLNYPLRSTRSGRVGAWLIAGGFVMMIVGNVAEFWIFTDLPYQAGSNARNLSWFTFLFGWLSSLIGTTLWGITGQRARLAPRWISTGLIMILPVSILLMFTQSIQLPTAVAVAVFGGWLLVSRGQASS